MLDVVKGRSGKVLALGLISLQLIPDILPLLIIIDPLASKNDLIHFNGGEKVHGLTGNDTIYGGYGSDILVGNEGNNYLYGGIGNDIFLFGTGSQEDVIIEKANEGTQDQVYFVGVTEFQVGAFKYNNDLLLTINNNTDIVALVDWYINCAVEYAYFDSTKKIELYYKVLKILPDIV